MDISSVGNQTLEEAYYQAYAVFACQRRSKPDPFATVEI